MKFTQITVAFPLKIAPETVGGKKRNNWSSQAQYASVHR